MDKETALYWSFQLWNRMYTKFDEYAECDEDFFRNSIVTIKYHACKDLMEMHEMINDGKAVFGSTICPLCTYTLQETDDSISSHGHRDCNLCPGRSIWKPGLTEDSDQWYIWDMCIQTGSPYDIVSMATDPTEVKRLIKHIRDELHRLWRIEKDG